MIKATYDPEADALNISLCDRQPEDYRGSIEDGRCILDLNHDGEVIGIEILNPPAVLAIAPVAARHGFAEHLDRIYAATLTVRSFRVSGPVTAGVCTVRT